MAELLFGTAIHIANAISTIITSVRFEQKNLQAVARVKKAYLEAGKQLICGLTLPMEVEARRNQIVHDHWLMGPRYVVPQGKMIRIKSKTRKGSFSNDFKHESLFDLETNTRMPG